MAVGTDLEKALINISFNDNITYVKKLSYNKTLDVQIGVYKDKDCESNPWNNSLTINLKPTKGWRDKLINCVGIFWEGYHLGYYLEIKHYLKDLINVINNLDFKFEKVLISGKSKGGGEALILPLLLNDYVKKGGHLNFKINKIWIGSISGVKSLNKKRYNELEKVTTHYPFFTIYRNDIVPSLVPWGYRKDTINGTLFIGIRTHGLSIKDHIISCCDRSIYE